MRHCVLVVLMAAAAMAASIGYRLGPGDRVSVSVLDLKEIEIKPALIELDGMIDLQYAGRIRAAGLTAAELSVEVEKQLLPVVRAPKVRVEVVEYGSQPVSILGAVNKPGVHQIKGFKTLVEVLSLAEGMRPEAGNVIKITRLHDAGPLPLPGAKADGTGKYYVADVGLKALLEAQTPELNIPVSPHDVISVPRADLVYVLGNVRKPGGFPLAERESITVLQALSLAEGADPAAAPQNTRILRAPAPGAKAAEHPVDVKKILAGKAPDERLQPNDIVFIPSNRAKSAGLKALETGIQLGTGIIIWRR